MSADPPPLLLHEALQQSAEEAQVFTRALPPYQIVSVTPAWSRLCGYSPQEVVGQTCKLLQGPATSREALEKLHAGLLKKRAFVVRLLNYTKEGHPFMNDLTIDPCCDVSGAITHFRGTVRAWEAVQPNVPLIYLRPDDSVLTDVVKQQFPCSMEEAQIIAHVPVIITASMRPFRISYVNNEWCRLCGFSVEEAIGRTCAMLQGPGTCQMTLDALHKAADEQKPISVRLLNYTKSDPVCPLLCLYGLLVPLDSRGVSLLQPFRSLPFPPGVIALPPFAVCRRRSIPAFSVRIALRS
ncbi:MAG: hypothetical protein SGPRY_007753 [Prymnesium sp.]